MAGIVDVMKNNYLSVIIPAYNEEDSIAVIIERVLDSEAGLTQAGGAGLELIVVDDGSSDRTAEIVQRYREVVLLQHHPNRGYGAALKTGLAGATGEYVAFLDADGTYPPEQFPVLFQAAKEGVDLVIGSRMSGEASDMPLMRRLGNWFFANLISLYGNVKVHDVASGMRVFKKEVLEKVYPLPDGLNFTPIMSLRAIHEGLKVVEIPIPYHERVGKSKLSVIRDGLRYLYSITWIALGYNPVRILGLLGMVGILLAVLFGAGIIFARVSGVTVLSRQMVFGIFLALVSSVAGVSLFNLGATFNYLISIYRKKQVREGLFGKPIFKKPIDRQFGWMGWLCMGLGVGMSVVSMILSAQGWQIERLWLYLVGSAMIFLIGVQLLISWIIMRKLEELSARENEIARDLSAQPSKRIG